MAADAQNSVFAATAPISGAQLEPSLSEVQLVEAFFDIERRFAIAAAAAAPPPPPTHGGPPSPPPRPLPCCLQVAGQVRALLQEA